MVVDEYFSQWAGIDNQVTSNNKLRLYETLFLEKNRDRTMCLLGNQAKDWEQLDDPAYKEDNYFSWLVVDFNNHLLVHPPPKDVFKIIGYDKFDPNNINWIKLP